MTHPDWAVKHKAKGTELRCIRGRYYLYRVSSTWDKTKKRARKITGKMIGTITKEDGLILKGTKKELKNKKAIQHISTKEYGASCLLQNISNDIIDKLKTYFPSEYRELLVLSINRLLHQSPLKNMEFLYNESFLSEKYPSLNLSKNALTSFMKEFGNKKETHTAFLRSFIEGNQHLVFDVTNILSDSKNLEINQIGYNSKREFDPQINLFYIFNTEKQMPLYYRIFPGNIHGISALELCIKESGIKNSIAIGDKGFYSEKNIVMLEKSGLNYILPLKRDNSQIKYTRLKSRDYTKAFDGHFFYNRKIVFYYELKVSNNKKIVVFFDQALRLDEETSYLRRVEDKHEEYSIEGYKEKQLLFGTISMITNKLEYSPNKIYESYKSRMEVEEVFDTYKNLLLADRTYMQNSEAINSWIFINHLALLMYYKIFNLLKEHNTLSKVSPKDLLLYFSRITKIRIDKIWHLSEINAKTQKLFNTLDINIT